MSEVRAPAFYASDGTGWRRDVWVLLHPPYTVWHLSYVLLGAALAPAVDLIRLLATLTAFFLAVGVAAHALDEINGRPLQTKIPGRALAVSAGVGLALAVALGGAGVTQVGPGLLPFIVAGLVLALAYNLELWGGHLHGDLWFSLSWGAFPVLTSYFAQTGRLTVPAVLVAAGAFALSQAQRTLSTPARALRRRTTAVQGTVRMRDGSQLEIDQAALLRPLEGALRALSWGILALGVGLVAARLA